MSAISSRATKAQLLEHIATLDCELRQARKDLEAQRLLTSIAQCAAGMAKIAPDDEAILDRIAAEDAAYFGPVESPRPTRTFMRNGVLMHKVPIGFNRFAIRPVQVTQ